MNLPEQLPPEVYTQLFLQTSEGLLLTDERGIMLSVNGAALKMMGYDDPEELVGRKVEVLIPHEVHTQHKAYRKHYTQAPMARPHGQGRELYGLCKDGRRVPLEISLSPIQGGGKQLILVHLVDITERKRLEQSLFDSEALLRSIIDNAVDGIITIDGKGILESVNPSAAAMFGYELGEMVGQNVSMLMPQPHRAQHDQYIQNYHDTGIGKIIGIGREVEGLRKDGSRFPFWLSISKVTFGEREIFTGLVHDISNIKRVERQLRHYAAQLERSNDELQDFAYVSSHDLQEPLRKIQAFGSRIQDREGQLLSEQGQDYLARMLNASERMQRLINDLLSYSRITTQGIPFQRVDLAEEINGVLSDLELLIEQTKAELHIDPLPEIDADPTQMRQLFQNLLANALKFRRPDDRPIIQVVCESIELQNGSLNPGIQIQFKDNGIGFDERYGNKIFTIFQRLEGQKYKGSGIGLAVCKRIVQRHHGEIEARSEGLNKGATFTVKLPLKQ